MRAYNAADGSKHIARRRDAARACTWVREKYGHTDATMVLSLVVFYRLSQHNSLIAMRAHAMS